MRPPSVVDREPALGLGADVVERAEKVCVEDFLAIAPVEAFDVGILRGLPWLDVEQPHALTLGPRPKLLGDQFWTVVDSQGAGRAVDRYELVEQRHHPHRRQRQRDLDRKPLAIDFVQHVRRAESRPAVEHVGHEVERPDPIEHRGRVERLSRARRHAPLRSPLEVEAEGLVHAIHALPVPRMTGEPEGSKAHPEPPLRQLGDERGQRGDHLRVAI